MMRGKRGGFTLIEVIIALGIMVMIAGLAWTTLAGSIKLRDILAEDDAVARSARVTLNRLSRELELSYITDNTSAIATYRTVFVGEDDGDESVLWFATTGHRRTYMNSRECDQSEVTVWTEEDPEKRGQMVLLHRETGLIDQEPDEGGAILPLARGVTRFQLRYYDGTTGEWKETWDTQGTETPNRLPRAVQIVLGLASPDPDDEDESIEQVFVRTVIVERADRTTQSAFARGGGTSSGLPGIAR
jgi:type II secretion system protein J